MVHYQNPRVLVACLAEFSAKLVLCRRAISPAKGLWFLPSGFMELKETLEEAAARELEEETGIAIAGGKLTLYCLLSIPHLSEVYVIFRTALASPPTLRPGWESMEVSLFSDADRPMDLAFPDFFRGFLDRYYHDVHRGHFPIRTQTIDLPTGTQNTTTQNGETLYPRYLVESNQ